MLIQQMLVCAGIFLSGLRASTYSEASQSREGGVLHIPLFLRACPRSGSRRGMGYDPSPVAHSLRLTPTTLGKGPQEAALAAALEHRAVGRGGRGSTPRVYPAGAARGRRPKRERSGTRMRGRGWRELGVRQRPRAENSGHRQGRPLTLKSRGVRARAQTRPHRSARAHGGARSLAHRPG